MAEVEVDRSIVKITGFAAVSALTAFLFGYGLRGFVERGQGAALAFVFGILWLALAVLHPYVVKSFQVAFGVFAIELAALVASLAGGNAILTAAVAAPFLLFLMAGFIAGRRELTNSVKIRFWQHGNRIVQAVMTGLSLFLALYLVAQFGFSPDAFSERNVRALAGGVEPVLQRTFPGFSLDGSVLDALRAVAAKQLPAGAPSHLIDQAADELLAQIRERTNAAIRESDSVVAALARLGNDTVGSFGRREKILTFLGIAFLIFVTLKGLAFIVNWPILLVSFAIYEILIAFRFMHLEFETQQKEIVVVK